MTATAWRPTVYSIGDTVRAEGLSVPNGTVGRIVEVYRLDEHFAPVEDRFRWTYTVAWATSPKPTYTSGLKAGALIPVWR